MRQAELSPRPRNFFKMPKFMCKEKQPLVVENLSHAEVNQEYLITGVETEDEKVSHFLFTLGCFEGEYITLISVLSENYVIAVKDARYSIDIDLARAIKIA